ncbi:DUF4259 domain-containing protein [Verrucosispora sp. WMMA2044]|uniref:DUF4259 domain-containing protein n=1 Tax=Verrucosispora sp. WMMA2044 TaxID=3016419 RepID=UPI00248A90AE|nr:DUF4259 domain-containing protein [Verrucosispora sp. WMMA2044]WBB50529.1 DUF4259 domain-containing protein [Verrucosispora sp. WMMA2044]
MGAWDSGPFDNDTAADWCGELDDADAAQRPVLVRTALNRAAVEQDYLDADIACEAIAAAAIVAAHLPGGQPISSPYAPEVLRNGGRLDLPADLPALAANALDRIMSANSEWHDLWQEAFADDDNRAFDTVRELRRTLTARSGTGGYAVDRITAR